MQIIKDITQGTEEWHKLRLGRITASKFKDVMSGGQGKTRKAYMLQLCSEIITDSLVENYTNEYMEWGIETEPQAKANYELITGNQVDHVAFIKHDLIKAGCSPDGLVGDDGMIEIKCPKTSTQIETFLSGKMPSTHIAQVQGQLWIAEREWCDFVSYDPRINGASSYFSVRVNRDEEYIKTLENAVRVFERELLIMVEKLR